MNQIHEEAMKLAMKEAKKNKSNNYSKGGPFGAVIVKDGKVIASAHNSVLRNNDSTAHAEINVIRKAEKKLKTNDLTGCILYTTTEPCPMCLSAIIWANIKNIYYGTTRKDAKKIGFRDDMIYEYLNGKFQSLLVKKQLDKEENLEILNQFDKIKNKNMY